jgi:hypothetical protein
LHRSKSVGDTLRPILFAVEIDHQLVPGGRLGRKVGRLLAVAIRSTYLGGICRRALLLNFVLLTTSCALIYFSGRTLFSFGNCRTVEPSPGSFNPFVGDRDAERPKPFLYQVSTTRRIVARSALAVLEPGDIKPLLQPIEHKNYLAIPRHVSTLRTSTLAPQHLDDVTL